MFGNRSLSRRTLLAGSSATLLTAALPRLANAAAERPPDLALAGLPSDFIGYAPIQRYFPETGHNVDGPVLTYFRETGGVAIHGYPLTEEYWEPDALGSTAGHIVQYFQRSRLEYEAVPAPTPTPAPTETTESGEEGESGEDEGAITDVPADTIVAVLPPPPADVERSALGVALGKTQPTVPPRPGVRYFPETGHNVGGSFLIYYDRAGGADVLGLPLSEEVSEDGRTVQWFENGRLEWWPENPPGQQVQLGLVGQQHLDAVKEYVPEAALAPAAPLPPLQQWVLPPVPARLVKPVSPARLPILYYHEVPAQAPLRAQIKAFREAGKQFVTMGQVVAAIRGETTLPENPLVLTFDDSWASQFTNVAPVLQAEGIFATFFVITRYLGTIPGYMTWDQVRTIKELGHEVESHTQNHADVVALSKKNEDAAIAEIWESLAILEGRLGHSLRLFAYPNGTWDTHTASLVARVYRGAVATGGGDTQSQDRLYSLRRIKAEPSYTPESLLKQM